MSTSVKRLLSIGSAMTMAVLSVGAGLAVTTAHADPTAGPVMHHVKYAVTAENPIYTDIYYLDHQPDRFSDYSHNPYLFTPHVDVDLGPGKPPWTYDLDMTNPDAYAMVVASTGTEPGTPGLHCVLAVDGVVVVSKDGLKGVLCSLRNW
ncbi:hypothetical protein BN1232_04985 [Mycobacterium lentiflavum]|uniref:Secreted protein n=2 Tax=Mycobacterium lentiflavum TaxID=141349 RepID=A0A0E3WDM8_MYCLN|nr:hypothetical protein BN1232_04985 [Mycobacterium lentiflavum]